MHYHGFYVEITSAENIPRENKNDEMVLCNGFKVKIYSNDSKQLLLDRFTAAVGFELQESSEQEVVQFIKDVIDSVEKEYRRTSGMLDNLEQKM